MLPHPLTIFEIQKYYQNKPKFNAVCSTNDLPKMKDGVYGINPYKYESIWSHWISLYVSGDYMLW